MENNNKVLKDIRELLRTLVENQSSDTKPELVDDDNSGEIQ